MIKHNKETIGVIGGGLAGLASACVLAARGYSVTLFEKNSWVGGKAATLDQKGFHFDMGPTILTLPSVLKKIYQEAGIRLEDAIDMVPLDPQWRCFFTDGAVLDLVSDLEQMKSRLNEFSGNPASAAGYEKFMKLSERLHDISERYFFYKPIGGLKDMFDWKGSMKASALGDVLAMRMGRSVASTVRSHIPDERVSQMVDHFTQYVGSSPMNSPAVLCGIASMQTEEGIWYPKGGTGAVPKALAKLAESLGVEIRTECPIEKIVIEGKEVQGVETASGEFVPLKAVVSNCDTVRSHQELMDEKQPAARKFAKRRSYEPACSGVVLYLGLKKRYDHIIHHNFVFSEDPELEFDYIYRKGQPAPDPTCYLCAPAATESEVAPEGGEALYVLTHTPYLREGQDWSVMGPKYRDVIINKLKTCAGMEDIEERIVFEDILTPQGIQDRYRAWKGAIYGLASHGKFLGAFKPSNKSPDVKGLYFAGGSAHPGPGMPMVMMSGWIAADVLDRDGIAPQTNGIAAQQPAVERVSDRSLTPVA